MIIKATVSGHGHTDKEGIQKVIKTYLGLTEFKTHDESDALAIALCHLLNHGGIMLPKEKKTRAKKGNGLANALAHRIKETEV
jgi:crossover junction endodeoxyribonuclease RuvC